MENIIKIHRNNYRLYMRKKERERECDNKTTTTTTTQLLITISQNII